MKLTKEQKRDIDLSIDYNIGEGYLDLDKALKMTYKQKLEWLSWSESRAEAEFDAQREMESSL